MIRFNKADGDGGPGWQMFIANPVHRLRSCYDDARAKVRRRWNDWLDKKVTAFFAWAIEKPSVQRVIANEFSGGTPMCRVMRDTIASYVDHNQPEIDANDVDGLDTAIRDAINDALNGYVVKAEDVDGLDDLVKDAIR